MSADEIQPLPRWEFGLGLGVLSLPFYRGAADGRTYIAPIPYIRYRGEHVRVDEEGTSILFPKTDLYDFSKFFVFPID